MNERSGTTAPDAAQLFARAQAVLRHDRNASIEILRSAIAVDEHHGPSLRLLGQILGQAGDQEQCLALLARAVEAGSPRAAAEAGVLMGEALRRWGRLAEAEAAYQRAAISDPLRPEAPFGLGLVQQAQGRGETAAASFRQAIARVADFAPAHGALAAVLLETGELAAAASAAEMACALAPNDPLLAGMLASVRNAQGRHGEAAMLCRDALAQGQGAPLLNTLGVALKEAGRLGEAAACLIDAIELAPALTSARYNLAAVRKEQGWTDEAVSLLRVLVEEQPTLGAARFALCMAQLPPIYRSSREIAERREDYGAELDRLIAWAELNGAAKLAPGIGAAQPFALAAQGRNDIELQARYGRLVCQAAAGHYRPIRLAAKPLPGERIRVGVVSGFFRDHSVWRLPTKGWASHLDRARFALFGYHTSTLRDAETERAASLFDCFVQGPHSVEQWRERIEADRPHLLLYPEIGMDPIAAQLGAMRLAPVQCASWGHPSTTGYPTIDHFLSSAAMEPADGQQHYTEHLVRLPGLSTPIDLAPVAQVSIDRARFGFPAEAIIFWCGQSLAKYLPDHDNIFAELAARVPGSLFVFLASPASEEVTCSFQARISAAFQARGMAPAERCRTLPHMAFTDYQAALACADVVLDGIGWSGCNSLFDAVRLGLPVVTTPGNLMRARHGAALLRELGADDLVCTDVPTFIDKAAALGRMGRTSPGLGRTRLYDTARLSSPASVRALEEQIEDWLR